MPDESTTAGPVELMRSFVRAFDRGDLDAQMSLLASDAVWEEVERVAKECLRGDHARPMVTT